MCVFENRERERFECSEIKPCYWIILHIINRIGTSVFTSQLLSCLNLSFPLSFRLLLFISFSHFSAYVHVHMHAHTPHTNTLSYPHLYTYTHTPTPPGKVFISQCTQCGALEKQQQVFVLFNTSLDGSTARTEQSLLLRCTKGVWQQPFTCASMSDAEGHGSLEMMSHLKLACQGSVVGFTSSLGCWHKVVSYYALCCPV